MGREERAARHESVVTTLPSSYNRRIGSRVHVDPAAEVSWLPLLPAKPFKRKRRPQRGSVVDLSLTGARIKARADSAIVVGKFVAIEVRHCRGVVEVRRIHAAVDPAVAFYGVQFVRLDPGLQKLIEQTLSARRPEEVHWRWSHSG